MRDRTECTTDGLLRANDELRRLATDLVGDGGDDLVQDVWLRALDGGREPAPEAPAAFWRRALRNLAGNRRRDERLRAQRERRAAALRWADERADTPFDLVLFEECRRQLVQCVEGLPKAQREVVLARYWEGLEPAEIAARRGERADAVRQRLRRAVAELRRRIDQRSGPGGRAAFLLPLAIGRRAAPAPAVTAAAGLAIGVVAMKKSVLLLLVCVVVALVWLAEPWRSWSPDAPPGNAAAVAQQVAEAPEAAAEQLPVPPPLRRERLAEQPAQASARRLRTAEGAALADVPYWFDERPFARKSWQVPEQAARTGADGAFRLPAGDRDRPDVHVWFALPGAQALAAEVAALRRRAGERDLRVPPTREMTAAIDALPRDQAWSLRVTPVYRDDEADPVQAGRHLEAIAGRSWLWVGRREQVREGTVGPARATFQVFRDFEYAVSSWCDGYDVQPTVQVVRDAERVRAHAAGARTVVPFRVYAGDGATPAVVAGRWLVREDASGDFYGGAFARGRGQVSWGEGESLRGRTLGFVLRDGEAFHVAGGDVPRDGSALRLVRGTGVAAVRQLAMDAVVAGWDQWRAFTAGPQRLQATEDFAWFDPFAESAAAGVWREGRAVLVWARPGAAGTSPVVLLEPSGGFAIERAGRLEAFAMQPRAPVDLQALLAAHVDDAYDGVVLVKQEVCIDPLFAEATEQARWRMVRVWRLHRPDGFGWRFSPTATIDSHQPLPGPIRTQAPLGWRSRLRLRVDRRTVVLPHPIR